MLFAKIPKEIEEYEAKILFGFSARQCKWGVAALILGGATYYCGHFFIPDNILSWIVMAVSVIPFMCGFIPVQGMPADDYFKITMDYIKKSGTPLKYDDGFDGEEDVNAVFKEKGIKYKRNVKKERKILRKAGENQ